MKARLVWLILCCIWGSTWLFIKIGLVDLPPLTFAGIRFVIAFVTLAVIIGCRRIRLPRAGRDWLLLAVSGVLAFSLNYGLVFWENNIFLPVWQRYCSQCCRLLV